MARPDSGEMSSGVSLVSPDLSLLAVRRKSITLNLVNHEL